MAAKDFRERPEFMRGRKAEQIVSRWLQEHGWYVIPSYDYAGQDGNKAPRLQGSKSGHAVPDLDIAKSGKRVWVEVKSKASLNVWHKAEPWGSPHTAEHGIDYPNYLDYLKVKQETGDQVWVAIYEEDTCQLRMAEIDSLGPPRLGTHLGKRIANWPRDRFGLVHVFTKEEAA